MPAARMAAESRTKPEAVHARGMSIVNVTVASNVAQAGTSAGGTSWHGVWRRHRQQLSPKIPPWWWTTPWLPTTRRRPVRALTIEANGPDFYGPAATALNNLISDASGITTGFTGNGNQLGPSVTVVPGLASSLANNGGPTLTLALAANSTARGAGSVAAANAFSLTTDQRGTGFSRIVSGAVDIGAYETQSLAVTPSGTTNTFTVGSTAVAVDSGVTVSFSGADLTGATVTISSGTLQTGDTLHFTNQNGITGSYASGVLTLSGSATPAQYQTALQSVTFSTTSTNTTTRAISIVAADNSLSSTAAAESVKVALATPAAPVVTPSGTTNTFTVGSSAVAVDSAVTVTFSGADLTGATVTISSGTLQTGDTLHFTNQNGITGSFRQWRADPERQCHAGPIPDRLAIGHVLHDQHEHHDPGNLDRCRGQRAIQHRRRRKRQGGAGHPGRARRDAIGHDQHLYGGQLGSGGRLGRHGYL